MCFHNSHFDSFCGFNFIFSLLNGCRRPVPSEHILSPLFSSHTSRITRNLSLIRNTMFSKSVLWTGEGRLSYIPWLSLLLIEFLLTKFPSLITSSEDWTSSGWVVLIWIMSVMHKMKQVESHNIWNLTSLGENENASSDGHT